ncbi:MAG: UDP-N-acetylenolpyruvoylglucosamine reductase [Acidobacteria bacterium]|nr:MAG: UDP-N-acetylenolpyruvoylglucosamine reductase [Acidobacteriota bacterium]
MTEMLEDIGVRLGGQFRGLIEARHPLAPLTTYRLGGSAALFVEPTDDRDLVLLKAALEGIEVPFLLVGRGSNLLVSEEGFPGLVIHLGPGFNWTKAVEGGAAAGAATPLPIFARWCADQGLAGIEFGVGIPGSVGGAVRMNAGGHGREIKDVVRSICVVDLGGADSELALSEIGLSYRRSALPDSAIVTAATFNLSGGDPEQLRQELAEITRWRREHQPGGAANAGSIFKNPEGDSAGRLIDESGLKGLRVGGAEVSTKHANFFLANEGATAEDISSLIGKVRLEVYERSGVVLEPEIRLVGEFAEWPAIGGAE